MDRGRRHKNVPCGRWERPLTIILGNDAGGRAVISKDAVCENKQDKTWNGCTFLSNSDEVQWPTGAKLEVGINDQR